MERWDSGYTAEEQRLGRSRATIKLALEQNTFEQWEIAWTSEKTGRELHAICPKPTKKILKIHEGLCKAASALIVQMKAEKFGLKKFPQSRKIPGFDSPECPCRRVLQSAKHLLIECRLHTRKWIGCGKKIGEKWHLVGYARKRCSPTPNLLKKIRPIHEATRTDQPILVRHHWVALYTSLAANATTEIDRRGVSAATLAW